VIKKQARIIVKEQYGLNINIEQEGAYEEQKLTCAEDIALKVKGLLDHSGPSNMAFTDGPIDKNVSQFFFLSKKDLT
jgi:hypothetical protein